MNIIANQLKGVLGDIVTFQMSPSSDAQSSLEAIYGVSRLEAADSRQNR